LQGQPLQILGVLIDQPGEVISREELQRRLWSGTTFVDFEQGLNAAVNKLRQALGDSADQPRYVETLPGRGYRFIAPVQRGPGKNVLEIAAIAPIRSEAPRAKQFSWWQPVLAVAVAALIGGAGYWLGIRGRKPAALKAARFAVTPPAGFVLEGAASRQSFALSPDGSKLAFTAAGEGGALSLFVREFDSLEARLIPETLGTHTLFWAPDGRSVYFTRQGKLRRVELENDAQVSLGEAPSFLFSGAWLSPGRLMLSTNHGSYAGSPSGGTPEPVKESYSWPQVLPGGEHVLTVEWDGKIGRYRAVARRLGDGVATNALVEADSRVVYGASPRTPGRGFLLYIQGGNLVARGFEPRTMRVGAEAIPVASHVNSFFPTGGADFSASDQGTIAYLQNEGRSQLVWVDRQGKPLSKIGPANVNVKSGRISPDGQRLVAAIYDVERGSQDLWVFDLKTAAGRKLMSGPGMRDAAVWAPDSNRLAYLHGYGGRTPLLAMRGLGEKDAEEAMRSGQFQMPSDWSSDGRFIAFGNSGFPRFASETQGDVWVADLKRERKLLPVLNTAAHEANGAFSPDGKWLAFTSNESGQTELYVQGFEAGETPRVTGERYPVSRSGALAVRWRKDGRELFYMGFDGTVYAVPVVLGRQPRFGAASPLFQISIEARASIHAVPGFDVSADGQRFVIPVIDMSRPAPAVVVVQNWEAGTRLGVD
jgi:Tol biopolymer transport system component